MKCSLLYQLMLQHMHGNEIHDSPVCDNAFNKELEWSHL